MNRRNFLKLFAGAAPVAAVAPTYFFAPVGGWPKVDPRLTEYQRMLLSFAERMTSPEPETAMGQQQLWYMHPAQRVAAEKLWGLPYYQMPSANERLKKTCELMDDYARRCGAEWTNKPWT